jgi:hypothetical protein
VLTSCWGIFELRMLAQGDRVERPSPNPLQEYWEAEEERDSKHRRTFWWVAGTGAR